MPDSADTLKTYREAVERYLETALDTDRPWQVLPEAMRYSLLAGGKRIRPVLTMAFAAAVGGDPMTALPAGAAVEMVHTYSLIHDDLPCMDNDDYRRGRLTNHKVYGEAVATLAGDGLLTAAFRVLAEMEAPGDKALRCVRILSRAAGEEGMVAGQILDLEGETRSLDEAELRLVHRHKTGDMIRAACQMGAVLGGGSEETVEAAGEFALHLGMAFQIRDDMLDEIGTAELGKPIGSDARQGKTTFVTLFGLDACQSLVEQETEAAISALRSGGFRDTAAIESLARDLVSRMK